LCFYLSGDIFFTAMNYKKRLNEACNYLEKKKVQTLIVKNSSHIFYLTGLLEIEGLLIIEEKEMTFFVPELYFQEAKDFLKSSLKKNINIQKWDKNVIKKFFAGRKKIHFIDTDFTFKEITDLRKKYSAEFILLEDFIAGMRVIKDTDEIKLIKKAEKICKSVFTAIQQTINTEMSELDIAAEIHYRIRKAGGRKEAFEPIVASGEHSSYPHHKNSNTVIQKGCPLVIDMGVDYQGYKSDLTRTFSPGGINKKYKEVYNAVADVKETCTGMAKAGAQGKKMHKEAVKIFKNYKLERYFIHGLGHGVGIDVHEKPVLSPRSSDILKKGSIFTIEPGIYIPGWGGVRIEDMVFL
jgi:Xaa-Pro aminopeptidase